MSRSDPDFIEAVDRAFRVIQAFSGDEPFLSVSRAAEIAGVSRPGARRILLTLERLKFVESEHGMFRLTPRVLRIGFGYLSTFPLWQRAEPQMRHLATELNEACSVATLDGSEIVYVARVTPNRSMSLTLTIGSRLPAYPTSMGRVLLAALPPDKFEAYLAKTTLRTLTPNTVTDTPAFRDIIHKTRERGFTIVDGEREEGVRSAAAPLKRSDGQVVAALNVSVNAARVPIETLQQEFVPRLIQTAADISRDVIALTHMTPITNPY